MFLKKFAWFHLPLDLNYIFCKTCDSYTWFVRKEDEGRVEEEGKKRDKIANIVKKPPFCLIIVSPPCD